MYYHSQLQFLQKMLSNCRIFCQVIDPNAPISQWISPEQKEIFRQNLQLSFYEIFAPCKEATVYRVRDPILCKYIYLGLPEHPQNKVFLIGPYLNTPISNQQILEQCERMGLPAGSDKVLELHHSLLPMITEESVLFSAVNTFAEELWGGESSFTLVEKNFDLPTGSILPDYSKSQEEKRHLDTLLIENRYRFENELIDAVSQGNLQKAEQIMVHFSGFSFESRANDPLRNIKNYCIVMNTVMRKAAEQGGVHPVHLDRTSSDLAKQIESFRSLTDLTEFISIIIRTYCRLVQQHSIAGFSPVIQKAMIRIENDLTDDLRLQTIAAYCNVSPNYLSGLFRKETGQSYTAYVNHRRIRLAKHLLKDTSLQIQTVAQHCGILDFHYFCRVFRSVTGMTPTQYRASSRN